MWYGFRSGPSGENSAEVLQAEILHNDKLRVFAADDWQKMKCLPSLIFLSAADKMLAKDSPLTL